MSTLRIDSRHLVTLDRQALLAYPHECCGALLGSAGVVEKVWPTRNVHPGPRAYRFAIDPIDLLRIQRWASDASVEVIGYYHSHPDRAAVPSEIDQAAAIPGISYLILAVTAGQVTECRSWRLREVSGEFIEERVL